jgi:hypothetical protein
MSPRLGIVYWVPEGVVDDIGLIVEARTCWIKE